MNKNGYGIAAFCLLFTTHAWSFTGNDLVKWEADYESTKGWDGGMYLGYVAGVAEFGQGILYCAADGVTHAQNAAIVTKYLKANPEEWNDSGAAVVVRALVKAYPKCPSDKK